MTDFLSRLERLAKLRESGALTEEEFNSEKIKILRVSVALPDAASAIGDSLHDSEKTLDLTDVCDPAVSEMLLTKVQVPEYVEVYHETSSDPLTDVQSSIFGEAVLENRLAAVVLATIALALVVWGFSGASSVSTKSAPGVVTVQIPQEGVPASTDTSAINQLYPEQARSEDHSYDSTRQDHVQTALEGCRVYNSGDTFTFDLCLKGYGITPEDVAWEAQRPRLSPSDRYSGR